MLVSVGSMSFTELDWSGECALSVGQIVLRIWSAKNIAVQARWAAVDLWLALRFGHVDISAKDRQKARRWDQGVLGFTDVYWFYRFLWLPSY